METEAAEAFARRWAEDWNSHQIDRIMSHFADDVVFTSPYAAVVLGTDGVVRGKEALRAYWEEGLRRLPDLHFEVLGVYAGVNTLVVNYVNQRGGLVSEVLTFDGDLVIEGHGTYARAG